MTTIPLHRAVSAALCLAGAAVLGTVSVTSAQAASPAGVQTPAPHPTPAFVGPRAVDPLLAPPY